MPDKYFSNFFPAAKPDKGLATGGRDRARTDFSFALLKFLQHSRDLGLAMYLACKLI
jgi:hypothetical protein